jgi:spermidine synthase
MAGWLRRAEINTDRNLRLQYLAGMALNRVLSTELLDDILVHYRFPDDLIEGSEMRMAALRELLAESGRYEP